MVPRCSLTYAASRPRWPAEPVL